MIHHPFQIAPRWHDVAPYCFTGQREEASLGLYFYNARWYDPTLGWFIQPDTLVPDPADARMFDRYAYVNNNLLKCEDGSGHCATLANSQADENYDCLIGAALSSSLQLLHKKHRQRQCDE